MKAKQHPNHIHNCILVRRWWRLRWVCIRCNAYFPADVTGQPSAADTTANTEGAS